MPKNKFLLRATAIVVIGPRQIGKPTTAHPYRTIDLYSGDSTNEVIGERIQPLAYSHSHFGKQKIWHWRIQPLSKILGGQNKILGGQKVVKRDKCMGVYQLFGARARAAPKSTPMQPINPGLLKEPSDQHRTLSSAY